MDSSSMHFLKEALRRKLNIPCCMAPEIIRDKCSGKIISAHTISKKSSLERIAADGHVYSYDLRNGGRVGKGPEISRIGVNRASTFSGFCKYHDSVLFDRVDQGAEIDARLALQLGFRSVSKEVYLKRNLRFTSEDVDKLVLESGLEKVVVSGFLGLITGQNEVALPDLIPLYDELSLCIAGKGSGRVFHKVYEFRGSCPMAFSSMLIPEFSPEGRRLQSVDWESDRCRVMTYSCLPTENGAVISITGISGLVEGEFLEAVDRIPVRQLANYFISLCFEKCENFAIRPFWWNSLSEGGRRKLVAASRSGMLHRESTEVFSEVYKNFDSGLNLFNSYEFSS